MAGIIRGLPESVNDGLLRHPDVEGRPPILRDRLVASLPVC